MVLVPAVKMLLTATPARMMVSLPAPAPAATVYTIKVADRAPIKAPKGAAPAIPGARAMAKKVQNPAPALTPMTLGEARGLESTAWMSMPLTAKAEPHSREAHTRGSRTWRRIRASGEAASPSSSSHRAAGKSMTVEPTAAPKAALATTSSPRPKSPRAALLLMEQLGVEDFPQVLVAFPPAVVGLVVEQILGQHNVAVLLHGGKLRPGGVLLDEAV